jgi:hypothetical protein
MKIASIKTKPISHPILAYTPGFPGRAQPSPQETTPLKTGLTWPGRVGLSSRQINGPPESPFYGYTFLKKIIFIRLKF